MVFFSPSPAASFQSTLPTRGSDSLQAVFFNRPIMFQSTLPTRGSDNTGGDCPYCAGHVSIHAPHEGERL